MSGLDGVTEIVPGIHRIASQLGSRPLVQWLAVGSRGVLLIDSGIAGTVTDCVVPALAQLGLAPTDLTDVVLSHADVDHYGGDGELRRLAPQARLRAHPLDRPLIECWEAIAGQRYGWYRRHRLDYPADAWTWLHTAAGPDTPLDGDLAEGERIDLGGLVLDVLHLPGHSAGHVGLLHADSETAIVLDAVMGRGFTTAADGTRVGPPPYLDVDAYRASAARLRALAPARLGTSHFAVMEGPQVDAFLDETVAFTDDLERVLLRTLTDEPQPLAALLPACDAAVGPFPEMGVELARSIGAHLIQLEQAGCTRHVADRDGVEHWALAQRP